MSVVVRSWCHLLTWPKVLRVCVCSFLLQNAPLSLHPVALDLNVLYKWERTYPSLPQAGFPTLGRSYIHRFRFTNNVAYSLDLSHVKGHLAWCSLLDHCHVFLTLSHRWWHGEHAQDFVQQPLSGWQTKLPNTDTYSIPVPTPPFPPTVHLVGRQQTHDT